MAVKDKSQIQPPRRNFVMSLSKKFLTREAMAEFIESTTTAPSIFDSPVTDVDAAQARLANPKCQEPS